MSPYAGPDDDVAVLMYCPAKRRPGLTVELFDRYWKDVHGPTCARLGFTWQYTQFHVAHDEGGVWRAPEGVERHTPPEEQIDGVAELTFLSPGDMQGWFDASPVLARDEQNVFGETTAYTVSDRNSRTYVDVVPNRTPNGDLGVARYHLMLKKRPEATLEELHRHLADTFAPNAARHPAVLKLRVHLLDPYDPDWDSPDVDHGVGEARMVHAAIEIAFATRLELARFQASQEHAAATQGQSAVVRQIQVFRERQALAVVQEGRATLAGLRGASIARTIEEAGAITNLNDDVVELFEGGAARFRDTAMR